MRIDAVAAPFWYCHTLSRHPHEIDLFLFGRTLEEIFLNRTTRRSINGIAAADNAPLKAGKQAFWRRVFENDFAVY